MSRPIDADVLKRKAQKVATEAWKMKITARVETILNQFIDWIDNAPTIEPERKPGKWIHGKELSREMISDCVIAIFYDGWKCSECDCLVEEEREPLYKYCPYCGAKMEGCEQE